MKNLISQSAGLNIGTTITSILQRFPLPAILIPFISALLLWGIHASFWDESIVRSILSFIIAFFLSIGISLFLESYEKNKYKRFCEIILPLVFGVIFYFSLSTITVENAEDITRVLLSIAGVLLFVFVAPFVRYRGKGQGENPIHFYNYFLLIAWTFFKAVMVGIVLLGLGFIAITSVIELFDLINSVDEEKIYPTWIVIALSLVAPLFGLIHLPERSDYEKDFYTDNRFFSFLIRYFAIPFIYIYFIILYLYAAKVLINISDWPKGMISGMIIGFSTFGYITYIGTQAYESMSRWVTVFRKYFPLVVLPQVAMLFYAIYLRIDQYGLTMNRYFVVAFGLWLILISVYYIFSRRKYLSIIPSSLIALIILISIGPWSVYSLPLERQYARLINNLEKAKILQNGVITPLSNPSDISQELSHDVYSGISYVCDFSDCSYIRKLFKNELKDSDQVKDMNGGNSVYSILSDWEIVKKVTEAINVESYGRTYDSTDLFGEEKYTQYNIRDVTEGLYPIVIEPGYTQVVKIYGASDVGNEKKFPYISIDPDTSILKYHSGTGQSQSISFTPSAKTLGSADEPLNIKDLTFTLTGEKIDVKIFLDSLAIKNPNYKGGNDEGRFYNINGVGLVRIK